MNQRLVTLCVCDALKENVHESRLFVNRATAALFVSESDHAATVFAL